MPGVSANACNIYTCSGLNLGESQSSVLGILGTFARLKTVLKLSALSQVMSRVGNTQFWLISEE
jgi:hypothetical protein